MRSSLFHWLVQIVLYFFNNFTVLRAMEDELEDRIFYQTYLAHMKLLSKFFVGVPLNFPYLNYVWKLLRVYVIKPEVVLLTLCVVVICMYIQFVDVWSRSLIDRIRLSVTGNVAARGTPRMFKGLGDFDSSSTWEQTEDNVSVYAIQGRRPRMEDRFVMNTDISGTGISLYAVFDGHGGEVIIFAPVHFYSYTYVSFSYLLGK